MTHTENQIIWLRWLQENGGSGYVDRYGRLVSGGQVSAQGAAVSWLKLIAAGLVTGGEDRLQITTAGQTFLQAHKK